MSLISRTTNYELKTFDKKCVVLVLFKFVVSPQHKWVIHLKIRVGVRNFRVRVGIRAGLGKFHDFSTLFPF